MNLAQQARMAAMVSGSVLSLALPFVGHEEGVRYKVYLDSVGVPTYCYGETENPDFNKTYTKQECDTLFYIRLGFYAYMVDMFIKPDMKPEFHAAMASWAYNVGLNAARTSKAVTGRANAGDLRGACEGLLQWRYAGGKPILLNRRMRERDLCLKGT